MDKQSDFQNEPQGCGWQQTPPPGPDAPYGAPWSYRGPWGWGGPAHTSQRPETERVEPNDKNDTEDNRGECRRQQQWDQNCTYGPQNYGWQTPWQQWGWNAAPWNYPQMQETYPFMFGQFNPSWFQNQSAYMNNWQPWQQYGYWQPWQQNGYNYWQPWQQYNYGQPWQQQYRHSFGAQYPFTQCWQSGWYPQQAWNYGQRTYGMFGPWWAAWRDPFYRHPWYGQPWWQEYCATPQCRFGVAA